MNLPSRRRLALRDSFKPPVLGPVHREFDCGDLSPSSPKNTARNVASAVFTSTRAPPPWEGYAGRGGLISLLWCVAGPP